MTNRQLRHPVNQRHHEDLTTGERLAELMAARIGSWRFLIIQSAALACWVVLNVLAIARHWDPYPFILLNLALSFQAAYTGPILLIANNRQAAKDRELLEHDYDQSLTLHKLLAINTQLTREIHGRIGSGEWRIASGVGSGDHSPLATRHSLRTTERSKPV